LSATPPEEGSFWNLFAKPEEPRADSAPSVWSLFAKEPEPLTPPPSEIYTSAQVPRDDAFFWAMRDLPVREAMKHLLVCGCVGSGKTTAIRLFLQSIAHRFAPGRSRPEHLIVFDAKGDAVPILAGLGLPPTYPNVWLLNPCDPRSAIWDVAEAVQNPVMARALAALLVPEEKQSSAPFFAEAARELVYAVMLGLNQVASKDWTLRDLLCGVDSVEHIRAITSHHPGAARLAARFLNDEKHSSSIISTLAAKLGRFEQVAALWHSHENPRRFRLRGTPDNPGFLDEPGVLILGNDPVVRESFWPLNAILLKALVHEVLRQPETFEPRFWFVLDEFRAMERVDCIHDLLNRGRSKGASVLLGIQSVEGIMEVYGENGATDLLSQCGTKVFLRAGGPKTAEWIESYFSKVRQIEESYSRTESAELKTSDSVQYSLQERSMFLASYFLNLPLPTPGGDYVAVCDVPYLGETVVVHRDFDQVLNTQCPPAQMSDMPARDDAADQTLWPWNTEEEERFCAPAKPPEPPAAKRQLPPRHNVSGDSNEH
jgi:hypothetical protein